MRIFGSIVFLTTDFLDSLIAYDVHCGTVGLQPSCYDDPRLAMPFYRFFQQCLCSLAFAAFGDKGFQDLIFSVDSAPEVILFPR